MSDARLPYVKPAVLRLRFEADTAVSQTGNCKNFSDSSGNNIQGGTCDDDNTGTSTACNVVGS